MNLSVIGWRCSISVNRPKFGCEGLIDGAFVLTAVFFQTIQISTTKAALNEISTISIQGMNRRLAHILDWTWCLPQTIMGLFWYFMVRYWLDQCSRDTGMWRSVRVIIYKQLNGGVSLGPFLFCDDANGKQGVLLHEYGHYLQSLLLGPFYLPLIGLPSICWAFIKKAGYFPAVPYHAFPTEWWAERLVNSQRRNSCPTLKIDTTVCVCKVRT